MSTVLKSGSLNLLEPSEPDQTCNGIALPFTLSHLLQRVGYGVDSRRIVDLIPVGSMNICSLSAPDQVWGPTRLPMNTGGTYPCVEQPEREEGHSPPSCIEA